MFVCFALRKCHFLWADWGPGNFVVFIKNQRLFFFDVEIIIFTSLQFNEKTVPSQRGHEKSLKHFAAAFRYVFRHTYILHNSVDTVPLI